MYPRGLRPLKRSGKPGEVRVHKDGSICEPLQPYARSTQRFLVGVKTDDAPSTTKAHA